LKTGEADILQQVQQWRSLIESLNAPLKAVNDEVEQNLLAMLSLLTRQLIYQEMAVHPELVLNVVREALTVLPVSDRQLKIYLNPQDLELVRSGLQIDDAAGWQWHEDPLVKRGGVRLVTADTAIDATVETRLNNLILRLLNQESSYDPS